MKILITGAKGFIGKNLIAELKNRKYKYILEYSKETDPILLNDYCKEADFVFHLAGVNRAEDEREFMDGNYGFTATLLKTLKKHNNNCPVMISSSTQAKLDNPYGRSKRAGEDLLFNYSKETGAKVLVYRFPNVFGKWSRPNYNSAIATFCHNISHDLPVRVNDPGIVMNLVYIDDLVNELIKALEGRETRKGDFCEVSRVYTKRLGQIVELIYSFKKTREECSIPDMSDSFTRKLYSTYLSYLPANQFSYGLKMNEDRRGSFTEFIKTPDRGQISVNILRPGVIKGNHWHHTKNEKFLVAGGKGTIQFRKIDSDEVIEYYVCGQKMEVVDIPPGYAHNIEDTGEADMVVIIWASEQYDPEKPDTYHMEVKE